MYYRSFFNATVALALCIQGGIALELSFLIPILGWFVLPLWVLGAGTGAAALGQIRPLGDPAQS